MKRTFFALVLLLSFNMNAAQYTEPEELPALCTHEAMKEHGEKQFKKGLAEGQKIEIGLT